MRVCLFVLQEFDNATDSDKFATTAPECWAEVGDAAD
jgi:hypothetical protein